MTVGDYLFMGAVVLVALLMTVLGSRIPSWLGFVLMLIASIVAIAGGAATHSYKAVPLGIFGVVATILTWVSGATSEPAANFDGGSEDDRRRDDPDTLGGIARRVPWWAWLSDAGLLAGAIVAAIFI